MVETESLNKPWQLHNSFRNVILTSGETSGGSVVSSLFKAELTLDQVVQRAWSQQQIGRQGKEQKWILTIWWWVPRTWGAFKYMEVHLRKTSVNHQNFLETETWINRQRTAFLSCEHHCGLPSVPSAALQLKASLWQALLVAAQLSEEQQIFPSLCDIG